MTSSRKNKEKKRENSYYYHPIISPHSKFITNSQGLRAKITYYIHLSYTPKKQKRFACKKYVLKRIRNYFYDEVACCETIVYIIIL